MRKNVITTTFKSSTKIKSAFFQRPSYSYSIWDEAVARRYLCINKKPLKPIIMFSKNDVTKVYDTILSMPGMTEMVKINLKISRRNLLLLHSVIERGIVAKDDEKINLLDNLPRETIEELKIVSADFLVKAGLVEFNEKLSFLKEQK